MKGHIKTQMKGHIKTQMKGHIKTQIKGHIKTQIKGHIKTQKKGHIKTQMKRHIKTQMKGHIKTQMKDRNTHSFVLVDVRTALSLLLSGRECHRKLCLLWSLQCSTDHTAVAAVEWKGMSQQALFAVVSSVQHRPQSWVIRGKRVQKGLNHGCDSTAKGGLRSPDLRLCRPTSYHWTIEAVHATPIIRCSV